MAARPTTPPVVAVCRAFVDALPRGVVGEIHLAGFCETTDDDGGRLAIDDHGSRVRPAVWSVYEHAVRRFGAVPTAVEWDTDLPTLELLVGEARQADAVVAAVAHATRAAA